MLCTPGSLKMLPCLRGASIIYTFLQIPTDVFISYECQLLDFFPPHRQVKLFVKKTVGWTVKTILQLDAFTLSTGLTFFVFFFYTGAHLPFPLF